MKKLLLFAAAVSTLMLATCKDDEKEKEQKTTEEDTLVVTPTELTFAADDTVAQTVTVETNVQNWSVSKQQSWFTISKGADNFSVVVQKNNDTIARVGAIIVTAGNADTVIVTVTQAASEKEERATLSAAPTELTFAADDTVAQTVTVETNVQNWSVSKQQSWFAVSKGADNFSVAVQKNNDTIARVGAIIVTAGNADTVTVTVTQAAGEKEEEGPVDWAADPALQVLKAFPGAEGFGANVTGGRGGQVIYVTNLNDNGAGSLRAALGTAGARIIMFKVAGRINLNSRLNITQGNVTIAGHTAPGDGICIAGNTVYVGADNVIIRHLRFRMGDLNDVQDDAIWGRRQQNIIIDHCSMSWSTDETGSFYDNENFTLQWCILSESLRVSVHEKGSHGYLGIWGGRRASFHHNLLAHHDSRNPRFCGSRYSNRPNDELVDFRNNVIFNWGSNSGYAGEGGSYNMVNNYYKPGASSSNSARIFQPNADDGNNSQPAGVWGKFYVAGNYMVNSSGAPNTTVINDNWTAIHPNPSSKSKSELRSDVEFAKGDIVTHTAQEAFELVLAHGGASFRRDATDARVTNEVRLGLTPARASGGGGTKAGLIDTQADVGGWDNYTYNPADVPTDTDGDGIPDEWELAYGLNPNSSADGSTKTLSGGTYTNLDVYLYDLLRSK